MVMAITAAADQRGVDRVHALLDVAVDVLQHDDGVVDDEADRKHESEQSQCVDGEAERIHQRKRADQRDRDRDQRDQRGAHRAEEQEDDQDYEEDRFADGLIDVLDRLGDEHRFVVGDPDLHAVGQRRRDGRQHLLDFLGDFERIGGRLLDYADRDRGLAVEADDAPLIECAQLCVAHVCEAHEITIGFLDDEIVELLGRAEVGLGKHGELALLALDAA